MVAWHATCRENPAAAALPAVARPLHRCAPMSFRPRILVATPHSAESKTVTEWLFAEGFEPVRLTDAGRLTEELSRARLDVLAVDASFAPAAIEAVRPHHPQLPIVVFGDADRAAEARAKSCGAVYLTRPLARDLLVCTVSLAISEPRPLRRSERKPTRLLVVAHGVPSQIIDVSKEGLRLELPKRGGVPPPIFDVQVPMLGMALKQFPPCRTGVVHPCRRTVDEAHIVRSSAKRLTRVRSITLRPVIVDRPLALAYLRERA